MAVLFMSCYGGGSLYQVKMTVSAHAEPCMPAIMKRFGYSIQLYNVPVKFSTYRKILYVYRNMIEHRVLFLGR